MNLAKNVAVKSAKRKSAPTKSAETAKEPPPARKSAPTKSDETSSKKFGGKGAAKKGASKKFGGKGAAKKVASNKPEPKESDPEESDPEEDESEDEEEEPPTKKSKKTKRKGSPDGLVAHYKYTNKLGPSSSLLPPPDGKFANDLYSRMVCICLHLFLSQIRNAIAKRSSRKK